MPRGFGFQSRAKREARAQHAAEEHNTHSFAAVQNAARLLGTFARSRRELIDTTHPAEFVIKREDLLRNIKRSQARDKYCWTLPVGLIGFMLWCLGLILHCRVQDAATVEMGLSSMFQISGYTDGTAVGLPVDTASFYAFLLQLGTSAMPDTTGVVNRYDSLIGGIRISQSRSVTRPNCSGSQFVDIMSAVSGPSSCYPSAELSFDPYWNASAVDGVVVAADGAIVDVGAAFAQLSYGPAVVTVPSQKLSSFAETAIAAAGMSPSTPFHYVFDYNTGAITDAVGVLSAAGWVDEATVTAVVSIAVVNYDSGFWARALFTITFTRGGSVLNTAQLRSLPIDPYEQWKEGLQFLDALLLVYGGVYVLQLARTAVKTCARARKLVSYRGWGAALAHAFNVWFLVDITAGAAIVATFALWAVSLSSITDLRVAVVGADWTNGA